MSRSTKACWSKFQTCPQAKCKVSHPIDVTILSLASNHHSVFITQETRQKENHICRQANCYFGREEFLFQSYPDRFASASYGSDPKSSSSLQYMFSPSLVDWYVHSFISKPKPTNISLFQLQQLNVGVRYSRPSIAPTFGHTMCSKRHVVAFAFVLICCVINESFQ